MFLHCSGRCCQPNSAVWLVVTVVVNLFCIARCDMNVAKNPLDFSNRGGLLSPSESHWLFELLSEPVTVFLLFACMAYCIARCDMNVAKNLSDFSNRVGLLSPSESHWLFELLSKPVTDWLLHPVFLFL